METVNATSDTMKGRPSGPIADIKDPVVDNKLLNRRMMPGRLVVPQSLRRSVDQVVAGTWPRLQTLAMRARLQVPRLSRVAVTRTDDQLEVQVDLPGVEPADVEVSLHGSIMTVRGARNRQRETRTKDHYHLDRYREVFERAVPLDLPVDAERATASLKYGVLHVRLPNGKSTDTKATTQIAVRAS